MKPDNLELARKVFAASLAGDTDAMAALCTDTIQIRQNGGPTTDLASIQRLARAIRRVAPDLRYENTVTAETPHGFVEEHDVCVTLPDGTALRFPACIVATVENGRIATMHEYFDTGEVAPLSLAMARPAN